MTFSKSFDYLIVGAGFAGAVCARELAEAGASVLVIDKRPHIGGNAYDEVDAHGVLIHPYGPHIFHTNSRDVFRYLSRFTDWRFYEHRVLAEVNGEQLPIPINRTTVNRLYGLSLSTDEEVAAFFEAKREPREPLRTSEDVVLNSVGGDLCDKFFRGYTKKQWGLDLSELSAGVAARIPTRTDTDDRYFTDTFQFMPLEGYTRMFERMLDHPAIEVRVSTDHESLTNAAWRHMVYTGPVDAFFGHRFGKLPYRSLSFEHEHRTGVGQIQPVGTVNYPNDHAYTRITEFKHLTGQVHAGTSIVHEYPQAEGDPFYPVPRPENEALFKQYQSLAEERDDVSFVGRLAQYRYYNMDQVVAAALACAKRLKDKTPGRLA
jgi:UDP-galactopyranose mutase